MSPLMKRHVPVPKCEYNSRYKNNSKYTMLELSAKTPKTVKRWEEKEKRTVGEDY